MATLPKIGIRHTLGIFLSFLFLSTKFAFATTHLEINNNSCKPISENLYGFSSNGYKQILSYSDFMSFYNSQNQLQDLHPKILRFPGGCPGDSYNYHTAKMEYQSLLNGGPAIKSFLPIDHMLTIADTLNTKIIYQINIDATKTHNACGDISAYPNLGSYEANLSQLIQDAKDIVSTYGTRIYLYELGNEQWSNMTGTQYSQVALEFAKAMKSINPEIKIALIGYPAWGLGQSQEISWDNSLISIKDEICGTVRCFTHITDHPYADTPTNSSGTLTNTSIQKYKVAFQKRISDFSPLKLAITEWNINNCWSTLTPPFRAQEQFMYSIKTLLTMAETGVDIATYHDMSRGNNSCSLFQPVDGSITFNAKVIHLFGEIQPKFFKDVTSDNEKISSYGIVGNNEKLYLFIINQSDKSETINNLSISEGIQITANGFSDQNPQISNLNSTSTVDLPAYSITRVSLQQNETTCQANPIPTRPSVRCISSNVSPGMLDTSNIGSTTTITAIIENPTNLLGKVALYNLDNLYSPGNPKPALLPSKGSVKASTNNTEPSYLDSPIVENISANQKQFSWTIKSDDINSIDLATGKQIDNLQLNIYAGGYPILDMYNCLGKLNLIRPINTPTRGPQPCSINAVCEWSNQDNAVRICKNGYIDSTWTMYQNHNCNLQKRVVKSINGTEQDISYMYGPPITSSILPGSFGYSCTSNMISWNRSNSVDSSPLGYLLMINDMSTNSNYVPNSKDPNYDTKDQWIVINDHPQDVLVKESTSLSENTDYDIRIQAFYQGEPYDKWSRHAIYSYTGKINCHSNDEILNSSESVDNTGDFNSDGSVNLNDFLNWKEGYQEKNRSLNEFLLWKNKYVHTSQLLN